MNRLIDFGSRFRILKGGKISLVVSALLGSAVIANAAPSGGVVTSGSANISQSENTTNIVQNTNKVSINWNKFNIASNETVNFKQPNVNSIALNRVIGNEKSIINGALNANGQVWILNSNGVLFGKNAKINTAGLLATTKNLSDEDFNAGNYNFKGNSSESVINLGEIDISDSGYATLLANKVSNEGTIKAVKGTVRLVGADEVTINLNGNSIVDLTVNKGVLDSLVENKGAIYANGGEIYLTTNAVNELLKGVVNNTGIIEADSLDGVTGHVNISSNVVINTGEIKGSSSNINIKAGFLNDSGLTDVSSDSSAAGNINIETLQMSQSKNSSIKANSANDNAGLITIKSDTNDENSSFYLSGNIEATGLNGGKVQVTANKLSLVGSTVDTSGEENAGTINIGGNWQGQETDLDNANETKVINSTLTNNGNNGQVVIWSDNKTVFDSIINAKDSDVEISSKDILNIDTKDILAKTLLLDPKNIEIGTPDLILNYSETDLNLTNNSGNITILANNNVVVANSRQTIGTAQNAGIVYLLSSDGTLISTLSGTLDNDKVGSYGITELSNGNYVIRSSDWSNNKGAVTFASGTSGVSGVVSSANSLVGTNDNDRVGSYGITALSSGNYVVSSTSWSNNKGAVTFADGATGIVGEITSSNSLVGTNDGDRVGSYGVTALSNGNYVVISSSWSNDKGAVTFADGTTGIVGEVSSSNSLVGTTDNDRVGSRGIIELSNGNYVVRSSYWSNYKGAVTFADGTSGITGEVSSSNSLVGTTNGDRVGYSGITTLSNGNYVVRSSEWSNDKGAVTFGLGTSGVSGVVSSSNSLVGTTDGDEVGSGTSFGDTITELSNGNYIIRSTNWSNNKGAVTFADGTSGITGEVSSSNSLVGTTNGDRVGYSGITALSNGNYLVRSSEWSNDKGAVTFGLGTSGITGEVSSSNSLVGTTNGDRVGSFGIIQLSNGNYLVRSAYWSNSRGAVTFADGTSGIVGEITSSNSLVGTTDNDYVGSGGITVLSSGNYLVRSANWSNNKGAVTFGSGTSGIVGEVSSLNSLVGTTDNDYVGSHGITALSNGNYVVRSSSWSNSKGAVTFADGTTGIVGEITSANSLVGTNDNDRVGSGGITVLSNGNYVVHSSEWSNNKGAVTFGSGATGIVGEVSSSNSLVGTTDYDRVGSYGVTALSNGNYLVRSSEWSNNKGAVTFGSGTTGVSGVVSSSNSLVGTNDYDFVGSYGVTALSNGNYVVISPNWSNNKGAVTFADGTSGIVGEISSANSLVGTNDGDYVGATYKYNDDKFYFFRDGKLIISDGTSVPGATDSISSGLFATNPSSNSKINYADIISLLEKGTTVILQANNDITLSHELLVDNINGDGGSLTFEAGRNININNNITTDNGEFIAIAGSKNANSSYKDGGTPTITIADGVSINTGTAAINLVSENGRFVNNNSTTNPFALSKVTNIYLPSFDNASLGGILDYNQITASSYDVCKNGDCTIPESGVNIIRPTPAVVQTTETPTPNINKAIAAIVNQESVTIPRPPQVTTPNNSRQNTNVSFSIGENRQVVSRPVEGQPTRIVSMSEARQMQQEATGQPVSEVRVPLSRSSIIALINGGVLLPGSLEQQFFVSENDK